MKILNKLEQFNILFLKKIIKYKYSFSIVAIIGILGLMNLEKLEIQVETKLFEQTR